jgi:citrate synthase
MSEQSTAPKPKKSVALSGVAAGNTALCTVGRSGNDLHYRGYDIHDLAAKGCFEEVAYLLVHGVLPNWAELNAYARRNASDGCYAHRLFGARHRAAGKGRSQRHWCS